MGKMMITKLRNVCHICKLSIDEKEHYCVLEEHLDKKLCSKGYYHVSCYRDKFIVPNATLKSLVNKSSKIFERIGIDQ